MIFSFEFGVPFLFLLLLLFCLHHVTSMVMSGPHRLRSRAIYRGLSDTFCGRKLVCRQTTLLFEFHMMGWHFVENWVWSQQSCREKFGEKMWRDGRALSKKTQKASRVFWCWKRRFVFGVRASQWLDLETNSLSLSCTRILDLLLLLNWILMTYIVSSFVFIEGRLNRYYVIDQDSAWM